MSALAVKLGGSAVVCCVHDREKRQIRSEAAVAGLGSLVGQVYDPKQHKLYECACCENLFVSEDDTPKFCYACRGDLVHPLGGQLPEPTGAIQ